MTYIYSSGNDTLEKFGLEDTIVIGDLSITSSVRGIDGDITLNMSNGGSIYILGMPTGFGYWSDKINTVASVEDAKRINIVDGITSVVPDTNPTISVASGTNGNDVFNGVGGANWSILCGDGDDVFYYLAEENISIDGGRGNDYIHIGGDRAFVKGGEGDDLINTGGYDNTISGGSKNDTIYGDKGNDSIVGNAGNDKLYGDKGNDTLWGGEGNDSLYGGDGKDIFIYKPGEGTDRIFDYSSGDILTLLKKNGKTGGTFTKSSFSGDDLTLAISGGGKVIFDGVSNGDKFNINGKTYTLSGKKLK